MPSIFDSQFPVLLPKVDALFLSAKEFDEYVTTSLKNRSTAADLPIRSAEPTSSHTLRNSDDKVATLEACEESQSLSTTKDETTTRDEENKPPASDGPQTFIDGLQTYRESSSAADPEDMMRTDNQDLAIRNTKSPLVDLFFELEDIISGENLRKRLDVAWNDDALVTLKIVFNARSIHLGKSSRNAFYRACGWLAQYHPHTLITNLPWLVRPIIPKKMAEKPKETVKTDEDNDEELEWVDLKPQVQSDDVSAFDVKNGVAHGYWKDLLNLLVLAVNGHLKVNGEPRIVLNVEQERGHKRDWTPGKERRDAKKVERHTNATALFLADPFYRCLHLTVARIFAEQLKTDRGFLQSEDKAEARKISLAAKWAPTSKEFHDKHTFITSTIAELLHPHQEVCPDVPEDNRELYLKHAREAFRRLTLSPLRKALNIVERDISAGTFTNIKYDRLPSLAMNRYVTLFAKKDSERFERYIEDVAAGKRKISGAVLLPSLLVSKLRIDLDSPGRKKTVRRALDTQINSKLQEIEAKVADGQWNTLVQRIKSSGTLSSSIAVCDVSGSMCGPRLPDGTRPMDSSLGLSLLVAEVTAPPFGGCFITFSERPKVLSVGGADDTRSFTEKIRSMEASAWGANTDFVAVFERLILPMAVENKLKPEEMVKQVFVFSDMHFDHANGGSIGNDKWAGSFDKIKAKYAEAGYEMPKLIFWNLAGGRSGDDAPKPVDSDELGVALVSGYSQAQLKAFMDNGDFEDAEEDVEVVQEDAEQDEEGDEDVVRVTKKAKMDPLIVVKKAISHRAYSMLKVVD